jgi:uroporphyrin-III C-methyltransferase
MSKKSKTSKRTNKPDSIEQAAMETYADSSESNQEHSEDDTQIRSAVIIETPEEAPSDSISTADKSVSSDINESEAKEAFSKEAEAIADDSINIESTNNNINEKSDEKSDIGAESDTHNNMHANTAKNIDESTVAEKKPSKTISWLALILSLVAIIAVFYIWWQGEQKQDQTDVFNTNISTINDKLVALNSNAQTQTNQQASSLKALRQQLQAQAANLQEQNIQLTQMQAALDKLQAKQTGNASYWRMLEVKHLIQTATIKLAVERDSATAIALLDNANIKLEGQTNSLELQKAIAADIGVIKANYPISPSRLLMQVESLHQQLLTLPLLNMTPEEVQNKFAVETEAKQSKDWLDKMLDAIKPAYNIIPVNRSLEPLLQPSERHYLLMNMTLSIQQIQIAITAGDQLLKDALIDKLIRWTAQYFDDKQEVTIQFTQALLQLKMVTLQATPPALKSLEWIEKNATLTSGAQ